MAEFDEEQVRQIRQIAREERSTNWGRVLFWVAIVVVLFLLLTYAASQTLVSET